MKLTKKHWLTVALLGMTGLVAAQQQADYSKMNPTLAFRTSAAQRGSEGPARLKTRAAQGRTTASTTLLVRLAAGDDAQRVATRYAARLLSQRGSMAILCLPTDSVAPLSLHRGVERMEALPKPRKRNDLTARVSSAAPAWNGTGLPQAYTGKGVVTGIVDGGFDFTHPTFLDAQGRSRVLRYWDILTHNSANTDPALPWGTRYTTPEAVLAAKRSVDATEESHGTHTMGTLAGSGAQARGLGAAWPTRPTSWWPSPSPLRARTIL